MLKTRKRSTELAEILHNSPTETAWDKVIGFAADFLTQKDEIEGGASPDLNALAKKAYPVGGWDEYVATWQRIGITEDHIDRFNAAGVVLQPKQLEFVYWARMADLTNMPNEIGMGGARAGGKSFGLFAQTAIDDCQRFPGLKVLYLRKTGKRAEEQMLDLVTATLRFVPHSYVRGKVEFPNGSRIIIGHFQNEKEAMNYLGIEYDIIVIEEATALTDAGYRSIRTANRSSKGFRPRIYNSTNPLGIGHNWYKQRFIIPFRKKTELDEKRKFIPATIDDNHFVNEEYVENLNDLVGNEYKAYRLGDWDVAAGAYFSTFNYQLHTIPPFQKMPDGWNSVWASMDYGFQHWNTVYLHLKMGDGVTITFDELAHRLRYPAEIAADINAMLSKWGLDRDMLETFKVGTDAFANTGHNKESIAKQYTQLGITMRRADTSPGSRMLSAQHIAKLLGDFERGIAPTWFITQNCEKLLETLPVLLKDPNNPEVPLKVDADSNGNGGDDPFDGARYGLYNIKMSSVD